MIKHFTIGRWIISLSTIRLRSWSRPRLWRNRTTTERIWYCGPVAVAVEDWTAEVYEVCACCGSADIGEVFAGDEGWTVCQSCRAVEQGYRYVNLKTWEEAT